MKTIRYKFLREGLKSQSGGLPWKIGEWKKHKGQLSMCNSGLHCSKQPYDAFSYVQGEILAEVEVRGKHLADDNEECWEEMRMVKTWKWQKNDSVLFAIYAARLVLHIYEDKYPGDKRPREAIEAAEAYQKCPCEKHESAARSAAWSAAWSAASAAGAAESAAWSAARSAAESAASAIINKCNKWMKNHIKNLEPYQNE